MVIRGALVLSAVLGSATAHAQSSRLWRPDERVVLSDLSFVRAVAADQTYLFIASNEAMGIYNHRVRSWETPVSAADGYPRSPVTVALADPVDGSVWLGTQDGLYNYSPLFREVRRISVGGGVIGLMLDRSAAFGGVYVRTRVGWEYVPPGGVIGIPPMNLPRPRDRVFPLTVEEILRRHPLLDGMRSLVLSDNRLRSFDYTSVAEIPFGNEFVVGTNGMGAILVDPLSANFTPLHFGPLGTATGAVAETDRGVWVGVSGRVRRIGFTLVSADLQHFTHDEGPPATGFGFNVVRDIVSRPSGMWAATDQGVVRFGEQGSWLLVDFQLPDRDAYALAHGDGGIWVGTRRGLAFLDDRGNVSHVSSTLGQPITALAAAGDSVWLGTDGGLVLYVPSLQELLVPALMESEPQLLEPIRAIEYHRDTLVVATGQRLIWRGVDSEWSVEPPLVTVIGDIRALAIDRGGAWVGGDRGFVFFGFSSRELRIYNLPDDLPGAVRDIEATGEFLWVATTGGLVRFSKDALR